jgi:hypothetical protein
MVKSLFVVGTALYCTALHCTALTMIVGCQTKAWRIRVLIKSELTTLRSGWDLKNVKSGCPSQVIDLDSNSAQSMCVEIDGAGLAFRSGLGFSSHPLTTHYYYIVRCPIVNDRG